MTGVFDEEYFQKLCDDTAVAPYVSFGVIVLGSKYNFWRPVVPVAEVWGHVSPSLAGRSLIVVLWDGSRPAKVTDLHLAVRVDQDVAWLKVPVHHSSLVEVPE